MIIGVPKEIKPQEDRVGLNIHSASELVDLGHRVVIQMNAGLGIGCTDDGYRAVGAEIVSDAQSVYDVASLIVKVKEPLLEECQYFTAEHTLFTFLHLAAIPEVANKLLESGVCGIAYETITDAQNRLPVLAPMSEIAGKYSIQSGARALERINGGKGVLLGGITGVERAKVIIFGGGVAGISAMKVALGCGADVSIFDTSVDRLRMIDDIFGARVQTLYPNAKLVEEKVSGCDLLIGAVLIPGAKAPYVVKKDLVAKMQEGSAIVDLSIDQGGCIETSRATTHETPMFIESGVVHNCITNMPAAVAKTANFGLNNVTLGYVKTIARLGVKESCKQSPHILNGLNIYEGNICHQSVAKSLGVSFRKPFN
ncbi:MAG: alanine dehydrogenase [Francisellaceae bacterium]|jgi:alanine dehydrogenase|nr:alanine dehydrogenase [Francisellaceae bacterium]